MICNGKRPKAKLKWEEEEEEEIEWSKFWEHYMGHRRDLFDVLYSSR